MPPANRIYVIGMGFKPFDKRAVEIIHSAKIILASNRLFDMFEGYEEYERVKDKIKVANNVNDTMDIIKSAMNSAPPGPIVLLASGDPMFSGIGSRTVNEFGKEPVEILPDLSSIQVAFSRLKEPWEEALLVSLHGGPDPVKRRRLPYGLKDIPNLLQRHRRIAILTDKENNPSAIARVLPPDALIYVFEKLGYPDEKVTGGTGEEISAMTFGDPNVVIIKKSGVRSQESEEEKGKPWVRFGLAETEIAHSRGLITKDEVRAVTLHKLRLPQKGVFWDIGAGSGSIALEAAGLNPELSVFAVEKDKQQIKHIRENRLKFDALNIEIIEGVAPETLTALPAPQRVFVGGSGGELHGIIAFVTRTPVERIVINATTMETLNGAMRSLEDNGFIVDVAQVSVSRTKIVSGKKHMSALNPVFIIAGERRT